MTEDPIISNPLAMCELWLTPETKLGVAIEDFTPSLYEAILPPWSKEGDMGTA